MNETLISPEQEGNEPLNSEKTEVDNSAYNVEIAELQQIFEDTMLKLEALRKEKKQLQKECEKQTSKCRKMAIEADSARKKAQNTERKLAVATRRLETLQVRYDALANSKLGKLTLHFWAKKAKKKGGKSKLLSIPAIEKAFSNLPSPEESQSVLTDALSPNEITKAPVIQENKTVSEKKDEPMSLAVQTPAPETEEIHISDEQLYWYENYREKVENLHESNGTRFYKKLSQRIGIICDEFFYDSIRDAADFVFITPDNWEEVLAEGIDVMLLVSAWKGLNEEWRGLAPLREVAVNHKRQIVLSLIEKCHEKGIEVIFYSKEDPPNYEMFLTYAKKSDYIFTSAKECIPYYQKDCENDKVYSISFGVNPQIHNPIGFRSYEKEDTVLFSGSWMKKYPDRCKEISVIFDGIIKAGHGLHIIDRNYPDNKNYLFPDKYLKYVSPALDHNSLQKLHKLFDWAVNINSVKESETMFANRAFELQANGVLLLSNLSVGVNNLLPTVMMVQDASEVGDIMKGFSEEEKYEHQIAGIRSVMSGHTCYDRIREFLSPLGIDCDQPDRNILVIGDKDDERVVRNFNRQTYRFKTLESESNVTVEMLRTFDMVTWFDSASDYGEFYLEDMINGFKFTSCDYVTKDAWLDGAFLHEGTEHDYVNTMKSKYRTVFWREAFTSKFLLSLKDECELDNGYSIDHFSYNTAPRAKTPDESYKLSVIVPVYNNGKHLYGKCFNSLMRSSMFAQMEIILVDDGSDDDFTLKMEDYLVGRYDNVSLYRFNDGGSGSASRPRNKGVELSTSEYIAFLDPDNEAVCDGFFKLYNKALEGDYDLVFGNMYKCTSQKKLADNYNKIASVLRSSEFNGGGFVENLPEIDFLSISIQAMVIKKSVITENNLEEVVGAIGQDTLFSWELLGAASRISVVCLPIHIYYSQTAASVTNAVGPKFFRKLMLLQEPKLKWLEKAGLLDEFMRTRYDYYTNFWILSKLCSVSDEDSEECAKITEEIFKIYAPYYKNTNESINEFIASCEKGEYLQAVKRVKEVIPLEKTKRPMPTREEMLRRAIKPKLRVQYTRDGNTFTFRNIEKRSKTDKYSWALLLVRETYEKVMATTYKKSPEFSYDFTGNAPDTYKIRAFLKNDEGLKVSDDVAYFKIDVNGEVEMVENESSATLAGAETNNETEGETNNENK